MKIGDLVKKIDFIGARAIGEAKNIKRLLSLKNTSFVCYCGVPNEAVEGGEIHCQQHKKMDSSITNGSFK